MGEECIFCRIGSSQTQVEAVYEDDDVIAFRDREPQAPVHALVIPKRHYETVMDVEDVGALGRIMQGVQRTAKILGLEDEGFRTVINCRENGGQTVYHLHIHLLGGRFLQWPPG